MLGLLAGLDVHAHAGPVADASILGAERHDVQAAPSIPAPLDLEPRLDVDAAPARHRGAPLTPALAALVGVARPNPTAIEKVGKRVTGPATPCGSVRTDDPARVGLPHPLRDTAT